MQISIVPTLMAPAGFWNIIQSVYYIKKGIHIKRFDAIVGKVGSTK